MDSASTAIITLIVIAILYFLPSFVAAGRERNSGILVLNSGAGPQQREVRRPLRELGKAE